MSKFKIGDIVKKKSGAYVGYTMVVDKVYSYELAGKVLTTSECGGKMVGEEVSSGITNYELVTPAQPQETEPEHLLRAFNDGQSARARLHSEYPEFLEYEYGGIWYEAVPQEYLKYRLKPKPAFKPFTVGSGWSVELNGDILKVGCISFDAITVKNALFYLCRKGATNYKPLEGKEFSSSRYGVYYEGHMIPWHECDFLLTALEKVGV